MSEENFRVVSKSPRAIFSRTPTSLPRGAKEPAARDILFFFNSELIIEFLFALQYAKACGILERTFKELG